MAYEYLNHTADLKVRAKGRTLEEAFASAALAGLNFLSDTSRIEKKDEHKISISAKRIESLLYDFLEELLFFLDTKGFFAAEFKHMKITEPKEGKGNFLLECTVLGDNYKNYEVKGDIKAITYSEMSIRKEKDGFVIEVVFDI